MDITREKIVDYVVGTGALMFAMNVASAVMPLKYSLLKKAFMYAGAAGVGLFMGEVSSSITNNAIDKAVTNLKKATDDNKNNASNENEGDISEKEEQADGET